MPTVEVEVDGRVHAVQVDRDPGDPGRIRVKWGESTHVVDARQLDAWTLSLVEVDPEGGSHEARIVERSRHGEIDVHIGGSVVHAIVNGRRHYRGDDASQTSDGAMEIVAPMPGKVVRLLVQPGDEVAAGRGVVVVEAMKMENELTAPRAGLVKETLVSEGTSVEAGKVLVVIE